MTEPERLDLRSHDIAAVSRIGRVLMHLGRAGVNGQ